jgi:hypothetical protein
MKSSPLRIGRDTPVASIPSAKGGAINFADAREALLASVECFWALVYSAIMVVEDERGGSGSEDGYARQPR